MSTLDEIRARNEAIDRPARVADDIAWLLAEVERLTEGPEVSAATGRPHPAVLKLRETRRQRDEAGAQVDRVTALAANWERLAAAAVDEDVREWCTAAAKSLRAVLAPVAPDAEPTEWEWSEGDVVLDADGIAWQRDGERIHYPWMAVGQPVQRDQDITDLVTKHGGRVLVCKARGIGGASC